MKNIFNKTKEFAKGHKRLSVTILVVLLIILYYTYKSMTSTTGQTSYVLGNVEKGTIVSSITGSGQVGSNHSLDLKPSASGNVVYIGAKAGDVIRAGQLIVQLDTTDAQKSVRDAEANLKSAEISLQKLMQPADNLSLLQANNNLASAQANLEKSYEDGFNSTSNTYIDLASVISSVDSVLHGTDASGTSSQQNISYYGDAATQYEVSSNLGKGLKLKNDVDFKYNLAKKMYDTSSLDFKNVSRLSDKQTIENIVLETYDTTKAVADSVSSAQNLIQYYQQVMNDSGRTPVSKSNTHVTALSSNTSTMNSNLSEMLSAKNGIANAKASVPESQASLDKLNAGPDDLDLQSAELSLTKAKNSLQDAKDNLNDYFIRAPFNGILAKVSVQKGDPAGSGTSVATVIATEEIVDIPLNEVDVSKVNLNDKATLTFDAIEGLTLTGKVASIDSVGTVSQGVVNYNVTISFDADDARIKPGMSTTASIITEVHPDVLVVPTAAVKSNASGSYVLVFEPALSNTQSSSGNSGVVSTQTPKQIPVTVGISDDTNTEIVYGLYEGDQIVTRTITTTTSTSSTSAPSATSLLGGNRNAGGSAIRGVAR